MTANAFWQCMHVTLQPQIMHLKSYHWLVDLDVQKVKWLVRVFCFADQPESSKGHGKACHIGTLHHHTCSIFAYQPAHLRYLLISKMASFPCVYVILYPTAPHDMTVASYSYSVSRMAAINKNDIYGTLCILPTSRYWESPWARGHCLPDWSFSMASLLLLCFFPLMASSPFLQSLILVCCWLILASCTFFSGFEYRMRLVVALW